MSENNHHERVAALEAIVKNEQEHRRSFQDEINRLKAWINRLLVGVILLLGGKLFDLAVENLK